MKDLTNTIHSMTHQMGMSKTDAIKAVMEVAFDNTEYNHFINGTSIADGRDPELNFGPEGKIVKATEAAVGKTGKYALIGGMGFAVVAPGVMTSNAYADTQDDPALDNAIVRIEYNNGTPLEDRNLDIAPFYMNTIVSGGPESPYHGVIFFTPGSVLANSHAHWFDGSGSSAVGFENLPEDVKVSLLGSNYNDFFDNNGTPDLNGEVTAIQNTNYPGNDDDPLPVELIANSLVATYDTETGISELAWATATEVNNYGFDIWRKVYDKNGNVVSGNQKIGFVEGHGNSNSPKAYSWKDENVMQVVDMLHQYQINQVDIDGTTEAFPLVEVTIDDKMLGIDNFEVNPNYPNPFNPTTTVSYELNENSPVTINVYNTLGEQVFSENQGVKDKGLHKMTFDGSDLASGMYMLEVRTPENAKYHKMQLMK
ncbi:MAG: T9SS type A sorting domain-containing protein [Ignavibacteriae bacterium]|nr:T9SS C-terminal target domain-containing protein [Ignavibacteriota bacterium]NOG98817.1 T9SS type A sorting domain-containing protein [Ignavibacteriota bacterium]